MENIKKIDELVGKILEKKTYEDKKNIIKELCKLCDVKTDCTNRNHIWVSDYELQNRRRIENEQNTYYERNGKFYGEF